MNLPGESSLPAPAGPSQSGENCELRKGRVYTPPGHFFLVITLPILIAWLTVYIHLLASWLSTSESITGHAFGNLLFLLVFGPGPLFAVISMAFALNQSFYYWLHRREFAVWLAVFVPLICIIDVLGAAAAVFQMILLFIGYG